MHSFDEMQGITPDDYEQFRALAAQEAREAAAAEKGAAAATPQNTTMAAPQRENTPRVATLYYIIEAQRNMIGAVHAICSTPRGRTAADYTGGMTYLNDCVGLIYPSFFAGSMNDDIRCLTYDMLTRLVDMTGSVQTRGLPPAHVLDRSGVIAEPTVVKETPGGPGVVNLRGSGDLEPNGGEAPLSTTDAMCEAVFRRAAWSALLLLPRSAAHPDSRLDRYTAIGVCARGADGGPAGVRDATAKLTAQLRKRDIPSWSVSETVELDEGLHGLRALQVALRNSHAARAGATNWYGKGSLMRMLASIFLAYAQVVHDEEDGAALDKEMPRDFRTEVCRQAAMCMELVVRNAPDEHWIFAMIELSLKAEDAELALASASTGAQLSTSEARKDADLARQLLERVVLMVSSEDEPLRLACCLIVGSWLSRSQKAYSTAADLDLLSVLGRMQCSEAENRMVHLDCLRITTSALGAERRYWRWRGAHIAAAARCTSYFLLGQPIDRKAIDAFVDDDGALAVAALLAAGASHVASASSSLSATAREDDPLGARAAPNDERETPAALAVVELCRATAELCRLHGEASMDMRNANKSAAVASLLRLCCVASALPDAQDGAALALRAIRAGYEQAMSDAANEDAEAAGA